MKLVTSTLEFWWSCDTTRNVTVVLPNTLGRCRVVDWDHNGKGQVDCYRSVCGPAFARCIWCLNNTNNARSSPSTKLGPSTSILSIRTSGLHSSGATGLFSGPTTGPCYLVVGAHFRSNNWCAIRVDTTDFGQHSVWSALNTLPAGRGDSIPVLRLCKTGAPVN